MKSFKVLLTTIVCLLFFCNHLSAQGQSSDGYKIKTIVIDAGHGGKDPGAIGINGVKEEDVVLNVSLMVGKYIKESFPQVNILYTRYDDVFIPLHGRAEIAREHKADLFISIHANSSTSKSVRGTEIYVLGLHKTEANLELAIKENASIYLEDNYEENYQYKPDDPETFIKMTMGIHANMAQSSLLASFIDNQFIDRVQRKSRGVKQAGFLVLHQNTCPSVLIELGFLSNPVEEEYLKSKKGQVYMASAIYRGFKEYKAQIEVALPEPTIAEHNAQPASYATKKANEGVVLKIQFMASSERYKAGSEKLNGITQFEIDDTDKSFLRYLSGSFTDIKEAQKYKDEIKSKGLKDAFIVAYQNGSRISISNALQILKK